MKKSSWALLVALVALITSIGAFFTTTGGSHPTGSTAGQTATAGYYVAGLGFRVGTEQSSKTVFNSTGQLTLGTSGTAIGRINFGTCQIVAYSNTIAASSTANVDCSTNGQPSGTITGISALDTVDAFATTSISSLSQGVFIIASNASTTAGIIRLTVSNGTGGTFTWSNAASTTVAWQDIHS